MKKITEIRFNWRQYSDGEVSGDDYDIFELGKNGVTAILDHMNHTGSYKIVFADAKEIDIYNPNYVVREKE